MIFIYWYLGFLFLSICFANECDNADSIDVKVTVYKAHVKTSDYLSKSDPFARVSLQSKTERTKSKSNTNNPEWNEVLEFNCMSNLDRDDLQITVFDYDEIGNDDKLLSVMWPYSDWIQNNNRPIKFFNNNKDSAEYWIILSAFYVDSVTDDDYETVNDDIFNPSITDDVHDDVHDDDDDECLSSVTLTMKSETGLGWEGVYYSWLSTNDVLLSSGTLLNGLYSRSVSLCLLKDFNCYQFKLSNTVNNHILNQLYWEIWQSDGSVLLKEGNGHDEFNIMCSDWLCDESSHKLLDIETWHTSEEDQLLFLHKGWNGHKLEIYNCNRLFETEILFSSLAFINLNIDQKQLNFSICIPREEEEEYLVRALGGPELRHIEWKVSEGHHVLASGGLPGIGGDCTSSYIVGVGRSCESGCFGSDCDMLTSEYGFLEDECDYFESNLSHVCNCDGCGCQREANHSHSTSKCTVPYYLSFTTSNEKKYQNALWEWQLVDNDKTVLKSNLFSTQLSHIELCMLSSRFSCYRLKVDDTVVWSADTFYSLTDQFGSEVVKGQAPNENILCSDQLCSHNLISVDMYDAYGDGWNGNQMMVVSCDGTEQNTLTLEQGSGSSSQLCLSSANFSVRVSGGTFQEEVFWSIQSSSGLELVTGGAPYAGSNCAGGGFKQDDAGGVDDGSGGMCESNCFDGLNCDAIDQLYGILENGCDYYGSSLTDSWQCNCQDCACQSDDEICRDYWLLEMNEQKVEEVLTIHYKWSNDDSSANVLISEGDVHTGQTTKLCKHHKTFMCYLLTLTGENKNETVPHWEVATKENLLVGNGTVPVVETALCEPCDGVVLALWAPGLNSSANVSMSVSDCSSTLLSEVKLIQNRVQTRYICAPSDKILVTVHNSKGVDKTDQEDDAYWKIVNFYPDQIVMEGNIESGDTTTCSRDASYPPSLSPVPPPSSSSSPTLFPSLKADSSDDSPSAINVAILTIVIFVALFCSLLLLLYWWQKGSPCCNHCSKVEQGYFERLSRSREQKQEDPNKPIKTQQNGRLNRYLWNAENEVSGYEYHTGEPIEESCSSMPTRVDGGKRGGIEMFHLCRSNDVKEDPDDKEEDDLYRQFHQNLLANDFHTQKSENDEEIIIFENQKFNKTSL